MTYIIENVNLLKDHQLHHTNMLVDGDRILSLSSSLKRYKHIRMDASQYITTPTHVIYHPNLPAFNSFHQQKKFFIERFILKGSTVFLTDIRVEFEHELPQKLRQKKTELINCPIDYCIGVTIPLRLLSADFMRKCKRQKIPAVFVELDHPTELFNKPWGWIREAMFPYNSPLIPVLKSVNEKQKKEELRVWKEILEAEKIPFIDTELSPNNRIGRKQLAKLGIYPLKSYLHQGGELSYNFYSSFEGIKKIDEMDMFLYHNNRLLVTVYKGKVIRAGKQVSYNPGTGENVVIKTPAFFSLS